MLIEIRDKNKIDRKYCFFEKCNKIGIYIIENIIFE